jgi:hypothetical protein
MNDLTAWLDEQGIPRDVTKRTPDERRQVTAKQIELADRAFDENPEAEFVSPGNNGKVTAATKQEIDLGLAGERDRIVRHEPRHRRAAPVVRRTRTRARSSLRSGRPSCTRRSSSRASASSGGAESDDPEPEPRLPLLAGPDRHLVDTFARLGVIA